MHPDYDLVSSASDLAVLFLEEPVTFNDYIQPLCLPLQNESFASFGQCWSSGWGAISKKFELFPFLSMNLIFVTVEKKSSSM